MIILLLFKNGNSIPVEELDWAYMKNQIKEINLILKHKAVFSTPTFDCKIQPSKLQPFQVELNTSDAIIDPRKPHWSQKTKDYLNIMNQKFINCGWLEKTDNSKYCSNPVVVWKNNKEGRYTCNFSLINEKTIEDPYH